MLSAEQVKNNFKQQGITFAEWARANGFKPVAVYQVVNGFTKSNYGIAHQIAVKLGMKSNNSNN